MDYMDRYNMWLQSPVLDQDTRRELEAIADNKAELEDRFYKDLEFGTGGLRGIIGAGSNRMNMYTVGKATQGLANYIIKQGKQAMERGVAIAYDSRRMSKEFTVHAALVLNANGIKTYVYDELQPTPLLSFSVRELGTTAGLVITASHNPPEYNGYKVYWEDGGQVVGERADRIIDEVYAVEGLDRVKTMTRDNAESAGLFNIIGQEVIDTYIARAKELCLDKQMVEQCGAKVKIIYTPLHGAGNKLVRRVLKELHFENVIVVPEQELPDHRFPTVAYPNPEDPRAFTLGITIARDTDADIIIATDPDGDRVGVAVKNKSGEFTLLTGNQTGALLVNYVMGSLAKKHLLPPDGKLIKTIVTSDLGKKIAKYYGIETIDTYTGFKFIAREIQNMDTNARDKFIFGYEESFGYMAGDFVRDKDAITASMLICEMTAWYKSRGMNLYDGLLEIWEKFGYYADALRTITMHGKEGVEKIGRIMDGLRRMPPKELNGSRVMLIQDYESGRSYYPGSGISETIHMESADVLRYTLENGRWFAIRPSGTEPKAKVYFSVVGKDVQEAAYNMERFVSSVMCLIEMAGG